MYIDKSATIQNIKIWDVKDGPIKELKPLCRKMAAEGSVLLENNGVLPFKQGTKVAVFGRNMEGYIKSGTGSGGLVRVEKEPCIIDSFRENGVFVMDEELVSVYEEWIKDHPFDNGHGWATEPWSQVEMPLSDELVKTAAQKNDVAVVLIGRTAGEDRDNSNVEGSYQLSADEMDMIEKTTANFKDTVVVLNVGNLIDLSFMDKYSVSAVIYVWQGGQEGADALADMLAGKISPCGKLTDTQVYNIEDHPSYENFGDKEKAIYEEDIYVGYRYFETFAQDKVRYPFGFGRTYTTFETSFAAKEEMGKITVTATVQNTGNFASREVVQVYFGAPCGKLGTPAKQLAAYKKTKELKPGQAETLEITFNTSDMAAYDDSGVTGNEFCYVLEQGDYVIYAGTDVRNSQPVYTYSLADTVVVKKLEQAMPAVKEFDRFVSELDDNGNRVLVKKPVPLAKFDINERIKERRPQDIPYTGDKGIKLIDVAEGRNSMEEFIAQIADKDLAAMTCGEGMNSPKVTPGTGGAFGGVTNALLDFGVPVCCVSDGPSGIRIGRNHKCTSLPSGYVFASSFDDELTQQIFELEGVELFVYNIDALLGPGMNIHRHPLCGRNFEYFSEDPLLSGKMAAAQSRGLSKSGTTATIKHFACNNQEVGRGSSMVAVSERALREIYLKGYEIAVKEGNATAIMTAYTPVNGYWTSSHYDLNTTILRNEWGYKGIVMTDWWAACGEGVRFPEVKDNLKIMVRAHNDLYMVCERATSKPHNILEGIEEGYISRGDLQYCAKNILTYIMKSPTFMKYVAGGCVRPDFDFFDVDKLEVVATYENIKFNQEYKIPLKKGEKYVFMLDAFCSGEQLAQHPIDIMVGGENIVSLSINNNEKGKLFRSVVIPNDSGIFTFDFTEKVWFKTLVIMK